jgi:hypothetical protein
VGLVLDAPSRWALVTALAGKIEAAGGWRKYEHYEGHALGRACVPGASPSDLETWEGR